MMVMVLDEANPLSLTVKPVPGPPLLGLRIRLPGTTVKFAEALLAPSLAATAWVPPGINGNGNPQVKLPVPVAVQLERDPREVSDAPSMVKAMG